MYIWQRTFPKFLSISKRCFSSNSAFNTGFQISVFFCHRSIDFASVRSPLKLYKRLLQIVLQDWHCSTVTNTLSPSFFQWHTCAHTHTHTAHKGGPIWRGCFYVCVCVCYKVHFSFAPPFGPGLHLLPSISQMSCVLLTLLTAWKKKWSQTIYLFSD